MFYGAIIGDIAGSKYEFNNIKRKPAKLMEKDCFFTDDTVMTIAVAHSLICNSKYNFGDKYRAWGNRYPDRGYGNLFQLWLDGKRSVNNSFGNGSAMRVSPVAYAYEDLDRVKEVAELTALPTHGHPEGIKGAVAVASLTFLARKGLKKEELIEYAEIEYGYRASPCDQIRPEYKFDETCQGTIPAAISAFNDSQGFEDCIRLAISLGGDSDTLAAIAGSIAGAYYGVPHYLMKKCRKFLPEQMLWILDDFENMYGRDK